MILLALTTSVVGSIAEIALAVGTIIVFVFGAIYVARGYWKSRDRDIALKSANESIDGLRNVLDVAKMQAEQKEVEHQRILNELAREKEENKTLRLQITKLETMVQGLQAIAELSSKIDKNQDLVLNAIDTLKRGAGGIHAPEDYAYYLRQAEEQERLQNRPPPRVLNSPPPNPPDQTD